MPDNESDVAGLNGGWRVRLSTRKLQHMGVTRQAAYRALVALERDHLPLVERRPGCCPVVTLVTRSRAASATATATAPDLS